MAVYPLTDEFGEAQKNENLGRRRLVAQAAHLDRVSVSRHGELVRSRRATLGRGVGLMEVVAVPVQVVDDYRSFTAGAVTLRPGWPSCSGVASLLGRELAVVRVLGHDHTAVFGGGLADASVRRRRRRACRPRTRSSCCRRPSGSPRAQALRFSACTMVVGKQCVRVMLTRSHVHAILIRMTDTRALDAGRHLILIDIENLAGTASPRRKEVEAVVVGLREVVPGFDDDQKIVACSHHAAQTVAFSFPPARHLWRSGVDGADLALLDVLQNERVHERFERLTICSGDGIFTTSAAKLAGAGVEVAAVALPGHLAARLQLAARHASLLPVPLAAAAGSAS